MSNELGYAKGDQCGRDGCTGIIDEHEKEGSCSCHINPPCGYCTTNAEYCPICEWESSEDKPEPVDPEVQKRNQEYYARQMKEWDDARNAFYDKFYGRSPIEKLEMRIEAHTHFSQYVFGVFPPGTETTASLLPKVNGTFGGRWKHFYADKGTFQYIAYTD